MKVAGLEKFLTTECNAEPYINCFDGYLTWHFQYPNQIPMFASIYAGRIQPFSRSYSGDETAQCMKAGQQLVFGEQLGWCDPHVVNDRPTFVALLRDCARIRYAERDCLAYGDMARPPVLKGDMPTVTADWEWGGKLIVTTDDGSAGVKGLVTDAMKTLYARGEKVDAIFTIGPIIMMKFVAETSRPHATPTFASLNPVMLDGTGMCGGCRVEVGGKPKFACVDGPMFDAHQTNFELLSKRTAAYKEHEKLSLERYMKDHDCQIGLH